MSLPTSHLQLDSNGVSVISLDYKPLNALHPQLLLSLFENLKKSHDNPKCKAIVVIGANKNFSPGFDINQFKSGGGGIDNKINDAFCAYLESGPKPTVAAIQGVALGGGLEVAMACNARVCCPGTRLGLPELQLGILPGFGGTQRLPRLIGLPRAIEMMLRSQPIRDAEALERGLIDAVVPPSDLLQAAKKIAVEVADAKKARVQTLYRSDRLEPFAEATMIIDYARTEAAKQARGLAHVLFCLDAIEHGVAHGGLSGLRKEGECFQAASRLDTHKALVHVFFAQRETKKVRGITDAGLKPRAVRCVAVLGGGLMGSGIATALAMAGVEVLLKEVNQQFLDAGMQRIRANLQSRLKRGSLTQEAFQKVSALVKPELTYNAFKRADMVIEAVIEDVPLKQRIFADLVRHCKPDCILSTNTSTIDINLIGAKTKAADRILGAHFFSPAHIMPLLEIVRTDATSKQAILDTLGLSAAIKKTPVVVGNCTGFAVNRVFFPYTMASCMLVDMGLSPYMIDQVIAGAFGMPMGPFRLNDLVGSDVGMHVGKNFVESYPERVYVTPLIPLMYQAKRLGEKTGKGFYKFDAKRRASPDPEAAAIVEESRRTAALVTDASKTPKLSPQDIIDFIFFPVVNEGCRVIAEGIVDKPADLDIATVMSMGFPPYKGGLIFWADLVGADKIVAKLELFSKMVGPQQAGFFAPSDYLRRCAATGCKLSAGNAAAARL